MVKKWLILPVVLLLIGVLSVSVALANPDLTPTPKEELGKMLLLGPDFAWSPISTPEFIFSPHEEGTAVWTGTEMIIWGGDYGMDGIRYELATDTWRWINPYYQPVPCPQTGHSALWTGNAMLIFGGWGYYNPSNCDRSQIRDQNGAFYYPATDSWAPAGSAGYHHTSVWTGTEVIMWGGKYVNGNFNDGTVLNLQDNTFSVIPSPPGFGQRYWHSAVWTDTEMIIWGGASPGGHYSDRYPLQPRH